MMKRQDFSIFVVISLILHALFFSYMLQWVRSAAQAKPHYDIIKVSIVQGAPRVKPVALPGRPAAGSKAAVLPKPLTAQPLPREKKAPVPEDDTPQTTTPDVNDAGDTTSTAVATGSATGTSAVQGSPGGVPAANAAAGDLMNAERAFANARDAYVMGLYPLIQKYSKYPALARKRGQEGKVQLRFVIGDDGRAEHIEVVSSSGYYLLDRAAMDTIRLIPLPRPPRRAMQVPVTIVYRLEDAP